MEVKSFTDLDDALDYIYYTHERYFPYFKVELLRTDDGRWRVGIITEQQLELDI